MGLWLCMRKKAAVLTQCVHIMLYIHNWWKSLTKPEDRIGGTARERPMQKEATAAFSYTLMDLLHTTAFTKGWSQYHTTFTYGFGSIKTRYLKVLKVLQKTL